jgi:AcrR family transcriptional regulator
MGGKRDPEIARKRILEAAEAAFAEEGYSGARVDAIAGRAGVNKRMLYHYFGDKSALYVAVMRHLVRRTTARMSLAMAQAREEEPVEALHMLLRAYFDAVHEEPNYARLIMHEAVHGWQALDAIEREIGQVDDRELDAVLVQILPVLRRGVEDGKLRAEVDPRVGVLLAASLCRFYVLLAPRIGAVWPDLGGPQRLGWIREQIVELLMHGLVAA